MQDLQAYLQELFEWLAEQFDFSVSGDSYNDSTVVSWLIRIWSKMGQGIDSRPVDPVSDPIGIGEWLRRLFDGLIDALMGLAATLLGGLADDLQTLAGKFPFCVPWDVAAVFALFVAAPVTPYVEYPLYTVGMGGVEEAATVVVDLAPYDGYMAVVRGVELAVFCAALAWKTKDVLSMMAVAGGDD